MTRTLQISMPSKSESMNCMELTIESLSTATGPMTGRGVSRIRYYSDVILPDMPKEFSTVDVIRFIERRAREWSMTTGRNLSNIRASPSAINSVLERMPSLVIKIGEEIAVEGLNCKYRKV
jgi:hypothetical protein